MGDFKSDGIFNSDCNRFVSNEIFVTLSWIRFHILSCNIHVIAAFISISFGIQENYLQSPFLRMKLVRVK